MNIVTNYREFEQHKKGSIIYVWTNCYSRHRLIRKIEIGFIHSPKCECGRSYFVDIFERGDVIIILCA